MLTRGIVAAHRAQQAGVPVLGNYNNKRTVMSMAKIVPNIIQLFLTRIFSNRPAGYIFFYRHKMFYDHLGVRVSSAVLGELLRRPMIELLAPLPLGGFWPETNREV
jgi:hypothetical protein